MVLVSEFLWFAQTDSSTIKSLMFVLQSAKNAKITVPMEIVLRVNSPAKKLSLENVFQLFKIAILPNMFLMESALTLTLHVQFSKR